MAVIINITITQQVMSVVKNIPDDRVSQKIRSIDLVFRQNSQENKYLFHKINRSKNRYNNNSLHSLEVQKNSLNMPERMKSNRRRLLIQSVNEPKQLLSERPNHPYSKETINKKTCQSKHNTIHPKTNRNQFISSIDRLPLDQKQKKIKDCIQLMQGVLQNIKIEKSQRRILKSKSKKHINLQIDDERSPEEQNAHKSISKLQRYVKNICQLRQENGKSIIVKINKNKSYNRQNIRSSIMLNLHKFQTLNHQKPKQIKPYDPFSAKKQKPYFDNLQTQNKKINPSLIVQKCSKARPVKDQNKDLQEIDFSMIKKVNESSFISSNGKSSLRRHFQYQTKEKQTMLQGNNNNRLILKIKNHRKLKNMFPDDFF